VVGEIQHAGRWRQGPGRRQQASHRFRRRVTIVLVGSLVGFSVASITLSGSPVPAEGTSTFTYGDGNAQAQSLDMAIVDSGADINVFAGQTTASYQDDQANAASSNVDIPLSTLLGSLQICSQPPPSLPLPTPLDVNTGTNGNTAPLSATDSTSEGVDGARSVEATPGSHADAQDSLTGFDLPGVIQVSGAQSQAQISANAQSMARTATATSDVPTVSLLGGAVQLRGLHWQLEQSATGPDNRSDLRSTSSSFSMSDITVGPVSIPVASPSELPQAVASANLLLAPLGVTLRLPTQSTTTSGQALSPLTIAVGGNKDLWGPVLANLLGNATFNQIQQIATGMLFDPVTCNELGGLLKDTGQLNLYWNFLGAAAPLVIGIFGQALGGSGEIDFDIGGVSTTLDDTYYPPITFGAPIFGSAVSSSAPFSAGSLDTSVPTILPTTTSTSAVPKTNTRSSPASPIALASSLKCETTSPAGRPMCWIGQAPLGAAITGAAIIGLLVADEIYARRRRAMGDGEGIPT
jgi:hypothetical protein